MDNSITEKKCSRCGTYKILGLFSDSKRGKYGKHSWCKQCSNLESRKWKEENKSKIKEYKKKWNVQNEEKVKSYKKKERIKNADGYKSRHAVYYQNNKLRIKENNVEWEKNNPQKVLVYRKKSRKKHYLKIGRNNHLKKMYGIDQKDYDEILEKQNGVCAVCGKKDAPLCVDHNHISGKVRGILCRKCNSAIGLLQDDKEIVKRAFEYLEKDR